MTTTTTTFEFYPPRKRRPAANSFVCPNLPLDDLLVALRSLSGELSSPTTATTETSSFFGREVNSLIRKCSLIFPLLDEISSRSSSSSSSSSALSLSIQVTPWLEELYILLQRISSLIEDCSSCFSQESKMWLLIQSNAYGESFEELNSDLLTLLEIMPCKELRLSKDAEELRNLAIKQCRRKDKDKDKENASIYYMPMRIEVLQMLASIKREIVPDHSKLARIFRSLGLGDSGSCREEIELLENEAQCHLGCVDDKYGSVIVELIGLVRYAKCVLFGASRSSDSSSAQVLLHRRQSASEANVPSDFRCPISLELMRDPVVVATGQTYDRSSIVLWIESGHKTCPKTGQSLAHTNLIPNCALRNLIAMWCRDQRISSHISLAGSESYQIHNHNHIQAHRAVALEATKMTVSFLVNMLSVLSVDSSASSSSSSSTSSSESQSMEAVDRVVYELRSLAKTDSDSRVLIGESGAIPLLVRHLASSDPRLRVDAVTTILNLSILEENKARIMEIEGAVDGVIGMLRSDKSNSGSDQSSDWEAKGNAAATLFSLAGVSAYRKKLGKKKRVVRGLLDLVRDGPAPAKRDALVAIVSLTGDKESVGKMLDGGAVEVIGAALEVMPEEAAAALEVVVKRGGMVAVAGVAGTKGLIARMVGMMRRPGGSGRAKESAAAALVTVCRRGGAEVVGEMAAVDGVEAAVWDVMGNGTSRAKRKAGNLMRYLQRWAAGLGLGLDNDHPHDGNGNGNGNGNWNVVTAVTVGLLEGYSLSIAMP